MKSFTMLFIAISLLFVNPQSFARGRGRDLPWKAHQESVDGGLQRNPGKVFEVTLEYKSKPDVTVTLGDIRTVEGYVPKYKSVQSGYRVDLLDSQGRVVSGLTFEIPKTFQGVPPRPGEKASRKEKVELDQTKFAFNFAFDPAVTQVQLKSPEGKVLETKEIKNPTHHPAEKKSKSIRGDEVPKLPMTSAMKKKMKKENATLVAALKKKLKASSERQIASATDVLNITFISDGYTDLNAFHNDVNSFTSYINSIEPFASRASSIVYHFVDNTTSLGCYYSDRLILCDFNLATQLVNNAGVPFDKIVILENNATYGGAGEIGGVFSTVYNGKDWGRQVLVHELGHSIGNLDDEYNLNAVDGPSDGVVHANCFAGQPPVPLWSPYVAPTDYTLGCCWPNWYRSSATSIMYQIDAEWFNPVSQILVNDQIDYFVAGTGSGGGGGGGGSGTPDTVVPVVKITSPAPGEKVSKNCQFVVDATDNVAVMSVSLSVDGKSMGTATSAPFIFNWDSTAVANGSHLVIASAVDAAGNSGLAKMNISTNNTVTPPVNTPPQVKITSPANGSKVKGSPLTVKVQFSGFNKILKTEIYVDGKLINTSTKPSPVEFKIDTKHWKSGTHRLQAKSYDSAHKIGSSPTVTVNK